MNASPDRRRASTLGKAPLAVALALAFSSGLSARANATAPLSANFVHAGERFAFGSLDAEFRRQFALRNGPLPVAPSRPARTAMIANCDDSGPGSLREAFTNAVSGDVIDLTALDCSTISLTNGSLTTGVDYLTVNGPGAGSPAIDAGSNPNALANDQRGEDYLREYGDAADIGAYEVQPPGDKIFANGFD